MAATGLIVQGPLDAVAALNTTALAQARAGYELMTQILGPSQAAPLRGSYVGPADAYLGITVNVTVGVVHVPDTGTAPEASVP